MAPLSYTWLLDLTLECHGQQTRPYEVIDRYRLLLVYFVVHRNTPMKRALYTVYTFLFNLLLLLFYLLFL